MTQYSRKELLKILRGEYQKADWKEKCSILDSLISATGYNRKYAIQLLKPATDDDCEVRRKPNATKYDAAVQAALIQMWEASNFLCGKRLVPFLKHALPIMESCGEITIDRVTKKLLLELSPATADRLLKEKRKDLKRCRGFTKAGSLMRKHIEIRTFADWNEGKPGFLEIDTVSHDGGTVRGEHAVTLTLTDVATGWTELVVLRGKTEEESISGIAQAIELFPFPILGLDADNGSEFMNHGLVAWCEKRGITFTRSRPYRKNDQCFVEEKNGSVVRKLVGHHGYRTPEAFRFLRRLYVASRLYVNFFQPSMKLISKQRIGAKTKRVYDEAKTPYERALSSDISKKAKAALRATFKGLNPAKLLRNIRTNQKKLLSCDSVPKIVVELPKQRTRCNNKGVAAAISRLFESSEVGEVFTCKQISQAINWSQPTVRAVLGKLVRRGKIVRVQPGRYCREVKKTSSAEMRSLRNRSRKRAPKILAVG